jgi:hypothetical protein
MVPLPLQIVFQKLFQGMATCKTCQVIPVIEKVGFHLDGGLHSFDPVRDTLNIDVRGWLQGQSQSLRMQGFLCLQLVAYSSDRSHGSNVSRYFRNFTLTCPISALRS